MEQQRQDSTGTGQAQQAAASVYEISNPSDPYTLVADDLVIAALTITLLGQGQYALIDHQGKAVVPFFMFGGGDEWFRERCGMSTQEAYDAADKQALADCLGSVLIGSHRDRAIYEAAMGYIDTDEKRRAFHATWHDKHCSSLNDIGGRAKELASKLRRQEGN